MAKDEQVEWRRMRRLFSRYLIRVFRVYPSYLETDEEEEDYRGRGTSTPTETRSTAKDRPGRRGPANDLYGL